MRASRLGALALSLCAACAGAQDATSAGGAVEPRLTAPPGLTVERFAGDLLGVRFMALGPDGSVYASRPNTGEVVRLADTDGDGVADQRAVAVRDLAYPHGLAFHDGWLYIANTDGVVRVRLDASGVAAGAPERVNRLSGGGMHFTRTVIFGRDGAMYVSVGSSCNVCAERDSDRAAVLRFDADGRNGRVFARGLRNAVGLAVHPTTGEIWASTHERDNLQPDHEDLPPEEIDILRDGGDYGWPYCYSLGGRTVPNPEFGDAARCAGTIPATLEMQGHSAPLGITFLDRATGLPPEYRGDALLAFHGSWNRSVPTGAKVVRIRISGGRPVSYEDFVTGWQLPDGSRWGRPADVMVYEDGSILISDDAGGAIYRVHR